jgi:hypothetical protein
VHYHDEEWCYSPHGPALRSSGCDDEGLTTVRFWLEHAAEFGFDHCRTLFRPDDETDYADEEFERHDQQRRTEAARAYQRFLRAPGDMGETPWGAWVAPDRRSAQVRKFLDQIGWADLPGAPWDYADPEVERIGGFLTDWFPNRKAMVATENHDRADQMVCFLGGMPHPLRGRTLVRPPSPRRHAPGLSG